jgi:ribosome-binding factor A
MRCFRVSELLKRHVSSLIGDVFPGFKMNLAITITRATMSKDLRNATIFYRTIVDNVDLSPVLNEQKAIYMIKSRIAKDLNLRFTPNIVFEEDKMTFDEYVDA